MTQGKRLQLLRQWSAWFQTHTETWKGPLGTQLAYLFAAIANDNYIELSRTSALVRLLRRESVGAAESVWRYIRVTEPSLSRNTAVQ